MGVAAAAGISAVGALGGGLIAAKGASKAANAQVQAADAASQTQRDIFAQQTQLQEPFRQGGLTAQNRLMTLLGLQPEQPNTMARQGGQGGQYDIPGWGGNYTTAVPSNANAMRAGQTVTLPGGQSVMIPEGGYYGGDYSTGQSENGVNFSGSGLNVDVNDPDFGKYARDFGMQDFEEDPGYAFRLGEGAKALNRSAAMRGGLQSGGALKAAARFGQEMGSQEYGRAFNRYQTNRTNQLNPLQSLMGAGLTSSNTLGESLNVMGNNLSELQVGAGNARASGYVGGANAMAQGIGGGLGGIGQNMMDQSYLSQVLGRQNGGYGGGFNPYGDGTGVGTFGGGPQPGGGYSYNSNPYEYGARVGSIA
jgi:hypothetical protein